MEITLRGVRLHGYHGVFQQEKTVGNEFMVDVSVRVPVTGGMHNDSLEGTVSYADIYEVVTECMAVPCATLEYLAVRIGTSLMERWPQIVDGMVSVCKLAPPILGFSGEAIVTYRF